MGYLYLFIIDGTKTAEQIDMPLGERLQLVQERNHVLVGGPDPPWWDTYERDTPICCQLKSAGKFACT